jgi:hypothetical protein
MPMIGALRRFDPVLPWKRADPNVNTPPSLAISQ